jgi:hypothetical protein
MQEGEMRTKTNGVSGTATPCVIADGDGPLSSFYTDDAVLLIIDRDNPRSGPAKSSADQQSTLSGMIFAAAP